jgi:hypothetical protein
VAMTTLDELLNSYALNNEFNVNKCRSSGDNKYDVMFNDIVFQFTIYAEDVKEAYIIFSNHRIQLIPKKIEHERWAICLEFPCIALEAFRFSSHVYLHLPEAINIQCVFCLSKYFASRHGKFIANELLPTSGSISFELNRQKYTMFDNRK